MADNTDKAKIKRAIAVWLRKSDDKSKIGDLRDQFPDISESTFYRLLREVRADLKREGAPPAIDEAKKFARANAVQENDVLALMPEPISPAKIATLPNNTAIDLVRRCMSHAEEAITHCRTADGKIKNLTGFLKASTHLRSSIDTMARVVERMNDAQKIEEIQSAMIEEIRKESPECAHRILMRIEAILNVGL